MEDRNEVHPRGLRDAITAAPLHKTKHVSIKSPDGTLTLYYNTCTLIKIGQENNGRMMQPPHFREVMSEELLHEVEEAEGRTIRFINNFDDNKYDENVQHDHNYSGDDHLSVAVYNMIDYGEHGTSQLGLADRGRLPFFRVGGVIMGDAVERQLQLLDRHLEHYNVNRADLYLCPHCFEFITEKVTESRRKEANNNNTTSSAAASTIDKNKPTEPTFDPLDILSTVNLKLQLPLIAFRYAKDWKAHLRLAHGYEKKNTSSALRGNNNTQNIYEYDLSPEEHRIRDHINRFLSLKNVKFFHERRFCKGISTTNSYWKSNGKYNTMRYNRIVEVCERAAMTSEGGEKITPVKKGRKGAERECEREILLVGPGYDGFGQGEKVIVQRNTNDLQRDYDDDDDEMKSITTSFGIPVVNLKRSRQYLTQQEIRTLVAFEDLPSMYEDEGEDDVNAFSGDEVKKSKTNKKSKNGKKQNKEALIVDDDDFDEDEESDSSTSSSDSSSSSSSSSASDNLPVNKEEEALIALLEQEVEEHREKQRKRKEERAHLISLKEEQDRLYKNNKEVPEDISPGEKRRRSIRIILDSDQENDEEHDLKDCGENESNIGLISQKTQDCLKSKSINVDLPASIAGTPGSEVRNTNPTTTGTSPLSSGTTIAGVSSSGSDGLTGTNKGKRSRISIDDDVVVKKERGSLRIGSILTTIPGLSLNPLAQLDPKEKEYSELLEAHEKRSHNEILEKEERMDDTYDDDRISNNLLGDSQLTENETYSNSNISISGGEEEKIRRSNSSSSSQSSSTGSSLSCRPRSNNNLTSEKRIFLQREAERLGRRNIQNTKEDWTRHSTASSSLKGKGKSSSIQQYFPPLIPHSTTPGKDPTHRIRTFYDSDTTLQQTKITSFVGKRSSKGTGRQRDQQIGAATFIRDHPYGHSSRGNKGNEEFQSLLSYGQEKLGEYEDSSSSSSTTSSSVGDEEDEEEENDDGIDTMPGLDQVIQQFKTSDNQNKPVVIKKKK